MFEWELQKLDSVADSEFPTRLRFWSGVEYPAPATLPGNLDIARRGCLFCSAGRGRWWFEFTGSRTTIADSDDAIVRACCDDSSAAFCAAAATDEFGIAVSHAALFGEPFPESDQS